jgi:hypothetical protein
MHGVLLSAGLSAWGQAATVTQDQTLCAQQAEKVAQPRIRNYKSQDVSLLVSIASHYNPTLGVCLVEIAASFPKTHTSYEDVTNAFEGTTLAQFLSFRSAKHPVDGLSEVITCYIDGTDCKSLDEFDALVGAKYGIKPSKEPE